MHVISWGADTVATMHCVGSPRTAGEAAPSFLPQSTAAAGCETCDSACEVAVLPAGFYTGVHCQCGPHGASRAWGERQGPACSFEGLSPVAREGDASVVTRSGWRHSCVQECSHYKAREWCRCGCGLPLEDFPVLFQGVGSRMVQVEVQVA